MARPELEPVTAGFSHVVSIPAGRLVSTSGQVAIDAGGSGRLEGWEGQTRLALPMSAPLFERSAPSGPDVVKLTFFVVDVSALATIRHELLDTTRPPSVAALRDPGVAADG